MVNKGLNTINTILHSSYKRTRGGSRALNLRVMDRQTTWHNRSLRSSRGKKKPRDGVLEDWPRPRVHLEDKILWPWPWPRRPLALALALALASTMLSSNTSLIIKSVKVLWKVRDIIARRPIVLQGMLISRPMPTFVCPRLSVTPSHKKIAASYGFVLRFYFVNFKQA